MLGDQDMCLERKEEEEYTYLKNWAIGSVFQMGGPIFIGTKRSRCTDGGPGGRQAYKGAAVDYAPLFVFLWGSTLKPLGDRVLVKINAAEDKITGGILLPTTVKTSMGEVVVVGEGMTSWSEAGVEVDAKSGTQVVYSKYVGTEVEFNCAKHLLLKRDDIVGIRETDHVKDLKPLDERVLIKVCVLEIYMHVNNILATRFLALGWAFGGLHVFGSSFGEEIDEITDLHQILEEVLLTARGDGVAGITRRRRDPSSDNVRDLVTASGRSRLKEDLESST
ncbi:20 kDa chaperonin, chloroplastic-like protein [Tanacetum coccineum]|uniref:20 kDa chaperonin, chloroplastic-like protein n=1 Tax=Tanacetum coccineum TaxID=301880 RepID=A0ABQ5HMG1_9ASTR